MQNSGAENYVAFDPEPERTLRKPQQEQHQVPPHNPQQHQYSDFELGMTASMYEQYYRMD
ncbi:hypothetical protein A2U01_0081884 [Trifolium medium]|uniref:Uncharacterized protein n=1 Tax=Trifolium medium TaxID=97028 RepID=A0A392THZ8_9FABA|nr:hypothetical protein [Trifolium medium]